MNRFWKAAVAAAGWSALGFAVKLGVKHVSWRSSPGAMALRRATAWLILPAWVGAAYIDANCRRRAKIESTTGRRESAMHTLMLLEAGPSMLAPLFVEVNAGVLAWMIGFAALHELTMRADERINHGGREISETEQKTERWRRALPPAVTAAAIATHWPQFLALIGLGSERARFGCRVQLPLMPVAQMKALSAGLFLFGIRPHLEEWRRCSREREYNRSLCTDN